MDSEDSYVFGWQEAFLICSMDFIIPLWNLIGLNFTDEIKPKLQYFARDAYTKCQQEFKHDYLIEMKTIIHDILNLIELELGQDVKEDLVFWCRHYIILPRQEDRKVEPTDKWKKEIIGLYYHYMAKVTYPNVLGWNEERYIHLAKLIESELDIVDEKLWESFEKLEEALKVLNLDNCSKWDQVILLKQLDEFGYLGVLCSRLHTVAEHYHLYRFWNLLEANFSPLEVNTIIQWITVQNGWNQLPKKERYKYLPPALSSCLLLNIHFLGK